MPDSEKTVDGDDRPAPPPYTAHAYNVADTDAASNAGTPVEAWLHNRPEPTPPGAADNADASRAPYPLDGGALGPTVGPAVPPYSVDDRAPGMPPYPVYPAGAPPYPLHQLAGMPPSPGLDLEAKSAERLAHLEAVDVHRELPMTPSQLVMAAGPGPQRVSVVYGDPTPAYVQIEAAVPRGPWNEETDTRHGTRRVAIENNVARLTPELQRSYLPLFH